MARPTPQEIEDLRNQSKLDKAYDKSLRMTAPAPKDAASQPKYASGGSVKGWGQARGARKAKIL